MACWLLARFAALKKEELFNGFLIAYLLSWYKNGYIEIRNITAPRSKQENCEIDLWDGNWIRDNAEQRVYDFLCKSADENNVLEMQELQYYCNDSKNKLSIEILFDGIMNRMQEELVRRELVTVVPGLCLDNTVRGHLGKMLLAVSVSLAGLLFGIVMVLIIVLGNGSFSDAFIKIFAVTVPVSFLGSLVAWGWARRGVKDKTGKTYARITDVRSESEQDRDSDGNTYTRITYFFRYEYTVNGTCYSGYGHSGFYKRKNQRIKIYYSKRRPQNSKTAARRNYLLRTAIFIAVCIIVTIGLCIFCDYFG